MIFFLAIMLILLNSVKTKIVLVVIGIYFIHLTNSVLSHDVTDYDAVETLPCLDLFLYPDKRGLSMAHPNR